MQHSFTDLEYWELQKVKPLAKYRITHTLDHGL
jgi:hypothetical protein